MGVTVHPPRSAKLPEPNVVDWAKAHPGDAAKAGGKILGGTVLAVAGGIAGGVLSAAGAPLFGVPLLIATVPTGGVIATLGIQQAKLGVKALQQ